MYRTPCCNIDVPKKTAFKSTPLWPVKCQKCGTKYHNGEPGKLYLIAAVTVPVLIVTIIMLDIFYRTSTWKYAIPLGFFSILLIGLYEDRKITQKGKLTKTTRQDQIRFMIKYSLALVVMLIFFIQDVVNIFSWLELSGK